MVRRINLYISAGRSATMQEPQIPHQSSTVRATFDTHRRFHHATMQLSTLWGPGIFAPAAVVVAASGDQSRQSVTMHTDFPTFGPELFPSPY